MVTKTIQKLVEAISNLDFQSQLAYSYILSERCSHEYITFFKINNWGKPDVLIQTLDFVKNVAIGNSFENEKLQLFKSKLETIAPDMDEFSGDILASFALNSCSILYECLEFIEDRNKERLDIIALTSIRSLETFIQHIENLDPNLRIEEFDNQTFQNPLMQEELKFQEELVSTLFLVKKIDLNFLNLMKRIENKLVNTLVEMPNLVTV